MNQILNHHLSQEKEQKEIAIQKLNEFKAQKEQLKKNKEEIEKEVKEKEKKKQELIEERRKIVNEPSKSKGSHDPRFSMPKYVLGIVILVFLTLFLFLFYSNITFSAFFRSFSEAELESGDFFNAIFYPNALGSAKQQSTTTLLLILFAPVIFIALGTLVHELIPNKDDDRKKWKLITKLILLLLFTFLLDAVLAYKLLREIYEAKMLYFPEALPPWQSSLAFQDLTFWLIIGFGFFVYIIWGFVYHNVLFLYEISSEKKIALRNFNKQMVELDEEIIKLIQKLNRAKNEINNTDKLIRQFETKMRTKPLSLSQLKEVINEFTGNWLAFIKNTNWPDKKLKMQEINNIREDFVKKSIDN